MPLEVGGEWGCRSEVHRRLRRAAEGRCIWYDVSDKVPGAGFGAAWKGGELMATGVITSHSSDRHEKPVSVF